MELTKYGNLMKLVGKEKYFSIRKSIALEAQKNGVKPTTRKFHMSKNNVTDKPINRNWVFLLQGKLQVKPDPLVPIQIPCISDRMYLSLTDALDVLPERRNGGAISIMGSGFI